MKDYISREAAREAFTKEFDGGYVLQSSAQSDRILNSISAADVKPAIHAEWRIDPDGYYPYCSHCKRELQGREMTDFCSNCGADMRENTDQEQKTDGAAHGDICGATGLPCCKCNPGACGSRK